ncbi:hypothetical protein CRUP_012418 [Coryphaenoides rupestris]|nr:hypothetical protein CRUP_012418 [Coryphaenoides rupestris]
MGFLHQLQLLLWKNISLKRRGPWVLAFEIFIPLVLFFILLGLRQKKPAIPVKEAFYSAAPLTSAGIIPIMQSLCPDGQRDAFGFLQYNNSTVTQLLERISEVVEQNQLFSSQRPGLGQEMEALQQHLDSLRTAPLDLDHNHTQGFTLASVLRNQSVFQRFLVKNLSLPEAAAHLLLTTPISLPEAVVRLLTQTLGLAGGEAQRYAPQELQQVEGVILTGAILEVLTCGDGGGGSSELARLLLVPERKRSLLAAYRGVLCAGGAGQRKERFGALSQALTEQLKSQSVIDKLHLFNSSSPLPRPRLASLLKDLAHVEQLFRDVDLLSGLARLLPKGACAGHAPPSGHASAPAPAAGLASNLTAWPPNSTAWAGGGGPNATDSPRDNDSGGGGGGGEAEGEGKEGDSGAGNGKEEQENPRSQFSAFVQLWAGLQPILCGNNRIIEPEALKQGNMSSLGFTSKEQRNLGLLVHLMTTNPKILYSPIGSQANETFAFVGNVTHYARVWLNISAQLRTFLEDGRLHDHLAWLQQLSQELQGNPELLNSTDSELVQGLLEGNYTLPNTSTLLEQLDTIDNAACGWTRFMSKVSVDIFKGFPDEDSIVNYTLNQAYQDNVSVFASVIFQTNKDGTLPPHVLYKIRQNSSFTEKTNEIRRAYWRPGPNTGGKFYFLYGFVWIQDMMERAIINTFVGHDVVEPGNYVQMFPYPCYTRDDFLFVIEHMMPLCMVISWVYSVAMMIQHIVAEKEHRLKEVMKMMGLNNAVHWVAWFITGFVQLSISVTALTVILKYGRVLLHSDPFIIWLFLTIYAVATIMFCYVPYMYVAIREEYFALYELSGVGIQWRTIRQSPVEGDDFNLGLSMMMLIVDACLYGVLTWYIEAVHPGMYGLPRPWYFPLQKSYWLGSGRVETWDWPWCGGGASRLSVMEEDQACAMEHRRSEEQRGIEEEPSHLPVVVCIDKLTKVYKTGNKLALDKLSLNLHENHVMSFLGHNGAGKTTTMSILTGLFPPTSGFATIYGHDIRTEMELIRQNLGMCPQHNVLFDKLSVEEHLWFYSRLKGMKEEDIRKEMDKMILDLELSNKRHSLVQTLSGGMKRKLSVAIAFVGGSRAVILDEPTAGVDPYARRAIWDLILKYKQGRTILLSTHHMDEADLLGDRIAIISHGKLKCCGSPLFLKSTYGDGYKLTLVKKQSEGPDQGAPPQPPSPLSPASSALSPCSEARVTQFIRQFVASCQLMSDTNTELSYVLPSDAVKKGSFERLFQALEQSLDSLALTSFGVMDTTLEEVFLKVSEEDQSLENSEAGGSSTGKPVVISVGGPGGLSPPLPAGEMAGPPAPADERREVELTNLVNGSRLSPSQASLRSSSSSVGSVRGDEGGLYTDFYGDYCPLFDDPQEGESASLRGDAKSPSSPAEEGGLSEGQGSVKLEGWWLRLRQFHGLIVKRFHCAKRNTKGLFSQILLPAFFVCVAMTVALSVPAIGDLPPLILSPSQYHNYTQPRGNFIPYANEDRPQHRSKLSTDAGPQKIINTLRLLSGVGATCVLKTPHNSTLDSTLEQLALNLNPSANESKTLAARYFDSMCLDSFTQGVPLSNFVPPPPSPAPSDDPDPRFDEDGLWNFTTPPTPTTAHEPVTSPPPLPLSIHEPVRCTCSMQSTGFSCPSGVVTGDILVDITGRNVSEYLLFTADRLRLHRYGGLTVGNIQKSIPASFGRTTPPMVRKIAVRRSAQMTGLQPLTNCRCLALVDFSATRKTTKGGRCNSVIHWLANYIWDMGGRGERRVRVEGWRGGWSITPIMYPASFWFEVPSTAYVFLIVINLFIGITATVATFLLQLFEHDKDLKRVNSYLKSCFLIFPNYNLGHGLMEMAYNEYINEYYAKIGQFDKMKSPFEWDIVTRGLVAMTIEGFPIDDDDVDVACERRRVLRGDADSDMLKIENLTKVYKSRKMGRILAVDRLCLGVRPGECFGLLGVNGAGKTSTFKMLTGDESTTGGEAFVVQWAIEKLELSKYADSPAGTYSGGNKRKLSTAIALIGYPSLIFLDEPTTGMDPKARRFLWNLILDIIKTGRSVVLTSHSMEECEALCTRLGIMVNGRFKCLGSIQHLKNRFGDGYMITVRTKTSSSVKEVERHHTKVQFQLQSDRLSLAQVFSKMEQVVEVLGIEDYSVSQTTLDNVFVNFAKKQSDNLDQQEQSSPSGGGQSPLQCILSLLKARPATTELSALVSEEPEELESDDDEGLISFEEERVQLSFNTDTLC